MAVILDFRQMPIPSAITLWKTETTSLRMQAFDRNSRSRAPIMPAVRISAMVAIASRVILPLICEVVFLLLAGCATAPVDPGGSLNSYEGLTPSNGLLTKSLIGVSKEEVLAAKTVQIFPTAFPEAATQGGLSDKQRKLVANMVDRALCTGLSDRFQVVSMHGPADLTVHAIIIQVKPTDEVAAGVSKAASIAVTDVLPALGLQDHVPVPVPRLPIGLGSLSIEAEAIDRKGRQKAAMIWGRGADPLTTSPRVSDIGDAYDFAKTFGGDFSYLLVKGESPFSGPLGQEPLSMPSISFEKIGTSLGGKPKYDACEAFGRKPFLKDMVGNRIGLPPEWTDNGAAAH
jgi:hypothetical protein